MSRMSQLQASQPQAVGLFRQAIAHGRLHHAYLLRGGQDSQALAQALTMTLMCTARQDTDACGACAGCRKAQGGNHPDVLRLGPNDKGIITIHDIRSLCDRLQLRAIEAPTKVICIEQAESMNPAAQNALLKTLEEPPGDSCFLLCASRPRRLLPTIRSRCQVVHVRPTDATQALQELVAAGLEAEQAALLAPLTGADVTQAKAWQECQPAAVVQSLGEALSPTAEPSQILAAAAHLGSDAGRSELALALLELRLRDALAARHGAQVSAHPTHTIAAPTGDAIAAAVRTLQRLRRLNNLHMNRTMALESVLLSWAGKYA